jgi:hypothetical protein
LGNAQHTGKSEDPVKRRIDMGDIFALQGRANCGKSETINKVYTELCSKYPAAQVKDFFPGSPDKKVVMTGVSGKKIGIESRGDPNSRLQQSLIDFDKAGCDIIFCAARTSGMTVTWIRSHTKYTPHFIPQTIVPAARQSQSNKAMAQSLIQQAGL